MKAIFLRMSATWKALRIVESMGFGPSARERVAGTPAESPILVDSQLAGRRLRGALAGLGLDDRAGAAGGLDALARAGAEGVGVHGQRLA